MNSVSNQILASILVTVIIAFVGWGFIEIHNKTKHETERLEKNQIRIAERLAINLSYPVWYLNKTEVNTVIYNEALDENVRAIKVFDKSGQLYAGIIREKDKFRNLTKKQPFISNQDLIAHRIYHEKKTIGFVVIYPNKEPIRLLIKKVRLYNFQKLTILIFALAGVLFLILRKVITKPLNLLKDWAGSIGSENMLPPPVLSHSTEITALLSSFSQMTERLTSSLNEISEKNEKLKESESRIKSINDNLSSGMVFQLIIKPDGTRKFTYLGDTVRKLYGVSPEEAILDPNLIYDKIHKEDKDALIEAEEEAMRTHSTFRKEVRIVNPSGSIRWSSFVSTPIILEDGSIIWDGIEFDITEHMQTEEELRISQQKFSIAFNSTPDAIFVTEMKTGRIIETNQAIKSIFGYTRKEAIGKTTLELGLFKNPDDRQKIYQKIQKNKYIRNLEVTGKHKSGSELTAILSIEICEINNIQCLITSIHDITERKQAEKKLRKSEERFKSIISVSNTGAWEYHSDSEFLWCSPEYFSMLGRNRDDYDMSGNKNLQETWVDLLHPDDKEHAINHFEEYLKKGSKGIYESYFRLKHQNESWIWIWSRGQTLRDAKNKLTNLTVGTHIDITERKLAEIELQKLNRDKDQFITILGHDLRSPFNAILGILNLLDSDFKNMQIDEIEEMIGMTQRSAQNASNLLDDLLMWAMTQSGKTNFELQKINFHEESSKIIELLKSGAKAKNISINLHSDNDLIIYADVNMFNSIIRNLLSNALKFTNNGGQINITAKKTAENTIISVSDNGVGIDPKNVDKLFDKTQLFTMNGTANEKGTGFGMKLCQEFVEKHGGKIWVESEVGKGSTFYFSLPTN